MDKGKLRLKLPSSRAHLFARISAFDLTWAAASPVLAFLIRDGELGESAGSYCATAIVASFLCFQLFKTSAPLSHYFSAHDAIEVAKACSIAVIVSALISFTFLRLGTSPRSVPILHFFILTGGLIAQRSAFRLLETRRAAFAAFSTEAPSARQNIIIVQASRLAWFYSKMVEELARHRTRIVAVLDSRPEFYGRSINGYVVVGSPLHITRILEEYNVHGVEIHKVVIAAAPDEISQEVWNEVQSVCAYQNIKIESLYEFFSGPSADLVNVDTPLFAFETSSEPLDTSPRSETFYWKIKRFGDIVIAIAIAAILLPITLIVAVCVLFDVGYPVLFWQQRIGYLGQPLFLYKFRTMAAPYDRNGNLVEPDSRISRLGLLLRKIRVDEIPQLINILTGHMSLIGPRPLLPVDQPENFKSRLQIRPGLTGLAQISGGKLLTPEEKDLLDDWYIRHANLGLDLTILWRTVWVILRGDRRNEGAIDLASVTGREPLELS